MIIAAMVTGIVGIILVVLGLLIWKKEKISILHDYHYDKVSEEDKTDFCKWCGIGILTIGAGLLGTTVIMCFTEAMWSFIPFAIGFAVGLVLLIYAGTRYNR